MDKLLAHIDIAQEDGTQNPSAAHSRVKAKTNGSVVSRNSSGVESPLGGSLLPVTKMLLVDTATGISGLSPLGDLNFLIPPAKSVRFVFIGLHRSVSSVAASTLGFAARVTNPSNGTANIVGVVTTKTAPTANAAASAGSLFQSTLANITPGQTVQYEATYSAIPGNTNPFLIQGHLSNLSTSSSANVEFLFQGFNNSVPALAGTGFFALIS